MQIPDKRSLMIANGWVQAAGIVLIVGFLIMGILTYYTYTDEPPIPQVVKDAKGLTRVDDVEMSAIEANIVANLPREQWMLIGWIPSNQKNGPRFQYVNHTRRRCCILAKRCKEAGVIRSSPMVDVVRLQQGSRKLLKDVVLLIRAVIRADHSNRAGSLAGSS